MLRDSKPSCRLARMLRGLLLLLLSCQRIGPLCFVIHSGHVRQWQPSMQRSYNRSRRDCCAASVLSSVLLLAIMMIGKRERNRHSDTCHAT